MEEENGALKQDRSPGELVPSQWRGADSEGSDKDRVSIEEGRKLDICRPRE